ncbi:hypothetical protein [Haloferula sargassicola]|uniref:Uncharacterized protein n=1 Tax=Haloferula sargassicola TaxID=490096 RepID=A0ABP9UQ47_9BACT
MSQVPRNQPPDPELERLVSRFLDDSCSKEERARLEERLQDEPEAMEYCARAIRFDAALGEVLNPRELEWEETRRLVIDRESGPAWTLQRRLRLGRSYRRWRWPTYLALAGVVILATGGGLWWRHLRGEEFVLRNGDFEAMDLSQSRSPVSETIFYWQESFFTTRANLLDLNRATDGKFYARSGRNVVSLSQWGFLNQVILNRNGATLDAKPGLRLTVRGWYMSEVSAPDGLFTAVRFVASGYPDMVQYSAATSTHDVEAGGWHSFEMTLTLPQNLWIPQEETLHSIPDTPPSIDLAGKPLTLSIDCKMEGILYLDDLSIEVHEP